MTEDDSKSTPKPRRFWRRVVAVLIGIAVVAGAEGVLRIAAVAPDGTPAHEIFHPPGRAFTRDGPVYKTSDPYILARSFAAEKAAGTARIFIVGGSVAMGFPLEDTLGPGRLLQAGLDAIGPGRNYEVIGAAGFGFSSRDVARVATEVMDYSPDAVVVMTGHNEFLERRYVPDDAVGVGRARKILGRLRLYRVLEGIWPRDQSGRTWEPHEVSAQERSLVEDEFRRDLENISRLAAERKVRTIVVTMPSNIEGFRPYGPSRVPREEMVRLDAAVGRKSSSAGESNRLAEDLQGLGEQFPHDAWAAYIQGAYYWRWDRGPREALRLFTKARDLDPMPVRASSSLNRIVLDVGKSKGAFTADVDRRFNELRRDAGESATPIGENTADGYYFFDHCHPTFEGQALMTEEIIQALEKTGMITLPDGWRDKVEWRWREMEAGVAPAARAGSLYKIAYETGVNMDRPFRGLDYARRALVLYPSHGKAKMLVERLTKAAEGRYRYIGE